MPTQFMCWKRARLWNTEPGLNSSLRKLDSVLSGNCSRRVTEKEMDGVLVFFSIAACAFALFLRLLPNRMATGTLAVDHWYWKVYRETLRCDHQFPPILPQYLFDEHQW